MFDVLDKINDSSIDFFNIQTLSFDHPLTSSDLDEFKAIIFSLNNLSQIYFKDKIDLESIDKIKNLLSISGYVDDSKIEKYVVSDLSLENMEKLLGASYDNPTTWQVAYTKEDNNYVLADIPKCRELYSFLDRVKLIVKKEELTPFEVVLRVYDIVKSLEYDNSDILESIDLLPDIIKEKKASSLGFNKLFSFVLSELGYKTFLGSEKSSSGMDLAITAVDIKDTKYQIDGIYLFDPSMDSLSKDIYEKEEIRMINYNYFGLKFSDIGYSTYGDFLSGAFGVLAIDDYDYSLEKRESKDRNLNKELKRMEEVFGLSYQELYKRVNDIKAISYENIDLAHQNIYGENKKIPNYRLLIKENYYTRKSQLFNPTTNDILAEMFK